MFLIGFNFGLINDNDCDPVPVDAKLTIVGGFCWESKYVSQSLNLLLSILNTKYSSHPLSS